MTTEPIIPPHGGYKTLLCYRKSAVIFLGTCAYCKRFLHHSDRTFDQMVQAARSCKQNIIEGCQASGTKKKSEIFFTNVSRASLEELLEDYKDQLLSNDLEPWDVKSERGIKLRDYCYARNDWPCYRKLFSIGTAEELCNLMICLLHQTGELIDKLLEYRLKEFLKHGDVLERIKIARHEILSQGWSEAIYNYLSAAESPDDLEKRTREIIRKAHSTQAGIAKRHDWSRD